MSYSADDLILQLFDPSHADCIVSWVPTDDDLFLLAPATTPPLNADKVLNWAEPTYNPFVLSDNNSTAPLAYAELNKMPQGNSEFWLGHVIVDPKCRGCGLGFEIVRRLLHEGFERLGAQSICLVVFPENLKAVQCYLKAGFLASGYQHRVFEHREGQYRLLKMTLRRGRYHKLPHLQKSLLDGVLT